MKTRFSSIDIVAILSELQKHIGMRVNQVYDVDNKTYLIRLNRYEEKIVLLLESGMRIHTTEFEWPKNPSPSGFSMKLRKHIKNKRLESITQLGSDRIIDLQFGVNEAAYHVIMELYDRGNIVLTDFEYTILNLLRPRSTDSEDVKFIVREKYPVDIARPADKTFDRVEICTALKEAKDGDTVKKIIMPLIVFGPTLLEHVLIKNGFTKNCAISKGFSLGSDIARLYTGLEEAEVLMKEIAKAPRGFVIHKVDKSSIDGSEIITNTEFHPYLFCQFNDLRYTEHASFDKAVDIYFSSMEGQKIDLKAFQKEKEALKKLENVKKDHEKRLLQLHDSQAEDIKKAQLIEMNLDIVEKAILVIRSAIANQISWSEIQDIIKEAQIEGDPVAKSIKKLKLDINHFTMLLASTHIDSDEDEATKPQLIDIDLDYSAYANARKYYDLKRAHAKKEQKTIESSEKAFKNAEKKTKQALKEVAVTTSITKARKVMWFEKFLWFISSENYLVIAGRDVQQNELIVKKYMKANDLYVHADLHGASSLVIKNPKGAPVPPKTLNEAGTMAVCNSTAWDAKIVTSAWWVHSHQVSKTAPSGEYLTTGSFMIRGKKNYLAPAHLIMGFGFMFKLDEESCKNHANERCERTEDNSYEPSEESKSEAAELSDVEVSDGNDSEDSLSVKDGGQNIAETSPGDEEDQELEPKVDQESESTAQQESESTENEGITFPDTEVKLNVLANNSKQDNSGNRPSAKGGSGPIIIQQHKKITNNSEEKASSSEKQNAPKRGQKGKLKKIKEKYKYQDEEERQLRMRILASAGQAKEEKKKKGKDPAPRMNQVKAPKKNVHFIEILEEDSLPEAKSLMSEPKPDSSKSQSADLSDEEEENQQTDEVQMLNSLTGCPVLEDTLLFAVPVVGPYSSMLAYKYKVKIIPGGSRRGKAAKIALQIFLHEKTVTQREKDLLRSVKDQDISRNLPGKIKMSTANYKKAK